jgi:MarR family transcriptional regulator for hemolysin
MLMRGAVLQDYCLDLMQAARHWRRLADAVVRRYGLSEATALPLLLIARHPGLRQHALADTMGVEGPSLVRSLDQLCAAGLVTRRADPSDRRAKCLTLTGRGQALAADVARDLDARRSDVFAAIGRPDLDASRRVFRCLAETVERLDDRAATGAEAP